MDLLQRMVRDTGILHDVHLKFAQPVFDLASVLHRVADVMREKSVVRSCA